MRNYLFLPSFLLCAVLLYMPAAGITENEDENPATLPESSSRIVKLTSSGIEPAVLHMKREESVVFFLNDTKDDLVTLEINFNGKVTHCSSGTLAAYEDGWVRSSSPIGPKDFASTCMHEDGTYEYTVYGLDKSEKGKKGIIVVE